MLEVKITEDIRIGGKNPCFIIAEVGQNHQGDIEVAKKLIKAAKDAGANCVKFQKTCLNEKFTKKYLEKPYDSPNSWGKTYGEHKRHLEFSESQYRELFKYAQEVGILFTASAMDMVSFDFLVNIKVPFIKIGSGDSNNLLFLKYAASKKIPLIISTGMVDKQAVKTIYDIIAAQHKQFCLLHCISAYPVPFEDCNLTVLQDYKNTFDIPVGYSGQEVGTAVALGAIALGAKVLEKHITLDKGLRGTDHVCSLTPTEFQQLVRDVRVIEASLGTPIKKVVTSEIPCIDKLQKSLVMGCTKNKGEILYPGDVKIKVAEPKGLNALHFEDVIYKTLVYDKKEDEPLNEGDFC
ncbi:sialic acid synthase [Danaus plexippus]|uniref:N-acetylneuraminate-9-phosphate synthase n=1 Tax=Danaus plexippus plexippus TaxID=278856 RepID=A0A212FAD2_DANPL|nr:sialic acid synthase [Danaus plexippus]OWR50680.1 sialic acid synthase [Danaus plexippus plexippus]